MAQQKPRRCDVTDKFASAAKLSSRIARTQNDWSCAAAGNLLADLSLVVCLIHCHCQSWPSYLKNNLRNLTGVNLITRNGEIRRSIVSIENRTEICVGQPLQLILIPCHAYLVSHRYQHGAPQRSCCRYSFDYRETSAPNA
jgi:hypothetical protein